MRRVCMVLLVVLATASCAQYSLVEPKRQTIGGTYNVDAQIAWSKTSSGKIVTWTVDSPWLEEVRFATGLTDGDKLFEPPRDKAEDNWPEFKSSMRANDIMDFVVDSLARSGMGEVRARNLRPDEFGSASGFRFELSFLSSDGLAYEGLAAGAVIDDKLLLILYTGTHDYYFPKYREPVERLIGSVQII
jgi:hypothetical protein